jgi:L,D-peptidoglycan transpeptidase YkuD (ErfK/YbiS/YcfS/YnhG family)
LVVTGALRTGPGTPSCGRLIAGSLVIRCALGAGGIVYRKREGDGGTPAGRWRLRSGFFRSDRMGRPLSALPLVELHDNHGWCDDPSSSSYNKFVVLPFLQRHERLWRDDQLYDIVIILNYNMIPRRKSRGSAIFFHLASENFSATAGCIAISQRDMRRLLPRLGRGCVMVIR